MELETIQESMKQIAENIIILGGAFMAVLYGLKRIYNTARSVEQILQHTVTEKEHRDSIAQELKIHIKMEEDRDAIRDKQFLQIGQDLEEITREIRPNGGSSMKDQINKLVLDQSDVKERLASLEQWKKDNKG